MADGPKSAWRIYLAIGLMALSYLGLFEGVLDIKNDIAQVAVFFIALLVGLNALSLAQDDGHKRRDNG